MADKITKAARAARLDMWQSFKDGLKIKGFGYYQPPAEVTYRYPAPGSCALSETDHPNLFKNDWKTPFRTSEYNITNIEVNYDEDDPRYGETLISKMPELNGEGKRGHYDQLMLDEQETDASHTTVMYEDFDPESDEMMAELRADFDGRTEQMRILREEFAPTQHDYSESYNQINIQWNNRGATGLDNAPRMKEMFIELESWIEDVIGLPQIKSKKMQFYKGTAKKWQVLDDSCFERDEVERMQAAINAPSAGQLEYWQEKHSVPLTLPATNVTVKAWRDDPLAIESADFDPVSLLNERSSKKQQFLKRYEAPQSLAE